jgi:vacuolar-type H+-ATPase subunit I/STV1
MTESEFISEIKRKNLFNEKLLSKHKSQNTYKILQTKYLNKDTLIVKVGLKKLNSHRILHRMMPFAKASSIFRLNEKSKNKYALQKQYKEILESEQLQIEQEEQEYTLIREKQEYKILLNFRLTKNRLSMHNWIK